MSHCSLLLLPLAFSDSTHVRIYVQNISPGMKLLGVVTEVNQKDIVISLPGGLRGLVRASEASDFTDLGIEVTAIGYNWLFKFTVRWSF